MKSVFTALLTVFILLACAVNAAAFEADLDNLAESVSDELFSSIEKDVLSALNDMGINEDTLFSLNSFSLDNITAFFSDTLKDKAAECAVNVFSLLCIIMLTGSVTSLFSGTGGERLLSYISILIAILLSVNLIGEALTATVSVLKMCGNFMLSYIPIYTVAISLSGNAASALTYNSMLVVLAELLSTALVKFLPELIGLLLCIIISFSLNESISISRLINAVNKTVSIVLGVSAGAFTGLLSIKNILSVSIDSVSVRSIRFLISSLIPIIGSSISEAYSSLLGSINLIKGSVAFVGIIVMLVINLPVIAQTLVYYLSFTALSYISDSFSVMRLGDTLRGLSCVMRILMLLCVFEMFILIISTGIMLSLKGTV